MKDAIHVTVNEFLDPIEVTVSSPLAASKILSWYAVEAPHELEPLIKILRIRRVRTRKRR